MKLAISHAILVVAVAAPFAAAAPPPVAAPSQPPSPGAPVTDNRAPIRERFPDLDAYLGYLQKRSHVDGAWYREIRPGIYELQTGNLRLEGPGATKRTFTREELERKFGFSR